jgi:hypothetical protein
MRELEGPVIAIPTYYIDTFAVFKRQLWLSGWAFGPKTIGAIAIRGPGMPAGEQRLASYGQLESADVAERYGPDAAWARFDDSFTVEPGFSGAGCELVVYYTDGETAHICELGAPRGERAPMLASLFHDMLKERPPGSILEIGSRARSGVTRRTIAPDGWDYVGLDILSGPNVDRIGDAHELSRLFPNQSFDAVMAFSVLEHLLMPWKVIIEMNSIMKVGAIGLFTTHQCWPIHDAPWDFWRFSDRAWDGLLNQSTGFEIIERSMGEPAFVVAQRVHAVTNFGTQQGGWLASNVLFRKICAASVRWDVSVSEVVATAYPAGEIAVFPN